jgi:RNA polymerase sigma-70 factor (ECF subfamily)
MAAHRPSTGDPLSAEFEAAVRSLRPWLRDLASHLYRDTPAVGGSDLVQDVLVDATRCPDQVLAGSDADKRGWFKVVLARKIANAVRNGARDKRATALEVPISETDAAETVTDGRAGAAERAEAGERTAAVAAALASLTGPQREAIELRYFQGLSLSEVATRLGCSVSSVATLLSRGRARLRDTLRP